MTVYVYSPEQGRMVDKATGEPMNPPDQDWRPVTPQIIGDIEPYQSPIDGSYVSGRRAKRDDLAKNDCIDAADLPSVTGGKLKNKRFAKKRGLEHLLSDEARET